MTQSSLSTVTRAVRAGIAADSAFGAVVPPLHLSSTFAFESFATPRTYDYTRSGNPTRAQLADALADLEGGARGVVTSTGMSALTLVLQLTAPGDVVVAAHDCYGGTQRLLRALAKRGVLQVVFADLTSPDGIRAIGTHRPRLVLVETPSNPLLRITDIRAVAEATHAIGGLCVVDNTFLSPVLQQPIALGADIVVHSTTKYLNGHSDVVGGAVIARDAALGDEIAWWANCTGVTGAPFDSYLTLRGLRTLHSRMRDHLAGAAAVVDALVTHPAVERVYYPGLATHVGHELARAQQRGFGAMVSFELSGGVDAVRRFTEAVRCFTLAESLGGVESLVAHPATMTHLSMDADARRAAGISDSLVRLSVGIESPEDLAADVTAALDASLLSPVVARRTSGSIAITDRTPADVVLLGSGAIARELASQVVTASSGSGAALRICAFIDRSGYVFDATGIAGERVATVCELKASGGRLAALTDGRASNAHEAIGAVIGSGLTRPIVVDATNADTTEVLVSALNGGADVVLANKLPLAAEQSAVDRLRDVARKARRQILSEATVGAGLPVLDTIGKLLESGDTIFSIEGCPSGTLGFLFGELGRGERFSDSLRLAISRGYTEPDPRIDLSGLDVARKALILARSIGYRGELSSVHVESLVPSHLEDVPLETFLDRLEDADYGWSLRVNDERRRQRVLRYRAHVTPTSIAVGLVPVKITEPLGTLVGTDNQFTFTTARYREQPLVIRGPGAGPAVTAAGVFNDLLRVERARTLAG